MGSSDRSSTVPFIVIISSIRSWMLTLSRVTQGICSLNRPYAIGTFSKLRHFKPSHELKS